VGVVKIDFISCVGEFLTGDGYTKILFTVRDSKVVEGWKGGTIALALVSSATSIPVLDIYGEFPNVADEQTYLRAPRAHEYSRYR
jgi:hypothetical protein